MSASHRPVRKTRLAPRRPAHLSTALTAESVPAPGIASESYSEVSAAALDTCPNAAAAQSTAATPPQPELPPLVQQAASRLSKLMDLAGRVAARMLGNLEACVARGEHVYPGELIHVCRGLHVLAKCLTELQRMYSGARRTAHTAEEQVQQLEARLRKSFGLEQPSC